MRISRPRGKPRVSKCLKIFPGGVSNKNYSGFDRTKWRFRDMDNHGRLANKLLKARTKTERKQLESAFGITYSPLLELTYFDRIRISIIDPMHYFYLGTAKHMINVWLKREILVDSKFKQVQEKAENVLTPRNIGRIPRKISSSFAGFTADQWKNWTIIFSV